MKSWGGVGIAVDTLRVVDIIRRSGRPFCVLFSIFLGLITQLKTENAEHGVFDTNYPIGARSGTAGGRKYNSKHM
jgi:hypothetical protein